LLDYLKINQAHLVGHDLGARVAFAFALQFPQRLRSLTVGEAFIEGLAGTERMKQVGPTNPAPGILRNMQGLTKRSRNIAAKKRN
jgi:pimeloyl-ACP methyl ester carboxylesterase